MNTKVNIRNPLYNLLIERKYRWLRHLILIIFLGTVLLHNISGVFGRKVNTFELYAILGVYIVEYLIVIYINIYWSIPKLLLKKNYVQFIIIFLITLLISTVGVIITEYYIHKYNGIPFGYFSYFYGEFNQVLSFLFSYLMSLFYLTSISAVVFWKYWMINIKKVEQLKTEQFTSELNNLKNRISPEFLFDKLRKAARYCFTKPEYTSRILLQLSRVLRYQLYDSSRQKVLLNSEIKYLNDYLSLEELCNDRFDFKIIHPQIATNYLIPPLLLISLVEASLKKLTGQNGRIWINIEFCVTDDILSFKITDNRIISDITEDTDDHLLITKQLKLIQNNEYSLSSKPDKNLNQYITVFQYKL